MTQFYRSLFPQGAGISGAVAGGCLAGLAGFLVLPVSSLACTPVFDDNLSSGSTLGAQYGGSFVAGGWSPQGGTLIYNLATEVSSGRATFQITGLEEHDLSQSDLLEGFTSHDGSFTDGIVDQFLQVKMAGDIYDGYDGRVKLQLGMEYGVSGTGELGGWTGERDWSASETHEFAVEWGEGWSEMFIDGASVVGVDYTPEAGGYIPIRSLRIPNNGSYTNDWLLANVVYGRVTLCSEVVEVPPVLDAFSITPAVLTWGESWTVSWSVSGSVDAIFVCGAPVAGGGTLCQPLAGASGTTSLSSLTLAAGDWYAWLQASGPGGTATGSPTVVTVLPVSGGDDDTVPADDDTAPTDDDTASADDDAAGGDDDSDPLPPGEDEWNGACGCDASSGSPGAGLAGFLWGAWLGLRRRRVW